MGVVLTKILGTAQSPYNLFGKSVSLSSDASTLCVASGINSGAITFYDWDGSSSWIRRTEIERSGIESVALTSDAKVTVVGTPYTIFGTGGGYGGVITYSTEFESYTAIESYSNVNEGEPLTINVSTTNVDNNTELWWTIESNSGDFDVSSGSFLIDNNSGSFTVTPTADSTTEDGIETFTVAIRTGSTNGEKVAETNSITINDTSKSPPPTYTAIESNTNAVSYTHLTLPTKA